MTNSEAKKFITELIERIIEESKIGGDLKRIDCQTISRKEIEKKFPKDDRFPQLKFRISKEEIEELVEHKLLNEKYLLSNKLAEGTNMSPLEKLLYSILWKNGDLGKEKHVINGILGEGNENSSVVFYEFGRFLSNSPERNKYILDQHTLRCIAVCSETEDLAITEARQLGDIDRKKHHDWIEEYKKFYSQFDGYSDDFFYELDRLLFGAGKLIKQKK